MSEEARGKKKPAWIVFRNKGGSFIFARSKFKVLHRHTQRLLLRSRIMSKLISTPTPYSLLPTPTPHFHHSPPLLSFLALHRLNRLHHTSLQEARTGKNPRRCIAPWSLRYTAVAVAGKLSALGYFVHGHSVACCHRAQCQNER